MRNTFKDTITGLEKVFDSDIPKGSVVLVVGTEGTLKSTLVLNMLSNYLINRAEHGLYITLEQAKDSHLKNMEGIGIRRADSLEIFDYRDLRREWEDFEPDMVRMTEEILKFYEDKYRNLTVFALDSLNALHALSEVENSRRSMYHFFSRLREKGLTSFLIVEGIHRNRPEPVYDQNHPEFFLADGLIELGVIESAEDVKRYIQIRKMRSTKHVMEKHQLVIGHNGLEILGRIY